MKIAFLIEGINKSLIDSVIAAKALAEANNAPIFDAIESYSAQHSAAILARLPQDQWPMYALQCIEAFKGLCPIKEVISLILKPGFEQLISERVISEIPLWLNSINEESYDTFLKELTNTTDLGSMRDTLYALMKSTSDSLSATNLMLFLSEHTDIDYIYSLVGQQHLYFADQLPGVEILTEEYNIRKLQFPIGSRVITIEIHGGIHGKMGHFESLKKSCEKAGLVITAAPITVSLKRLLALTDAFESKATEAMPRFFKKANTQPKKNDGVFDLKKAADKFDFWMKNYLHPADVDVSSQLVDWLYLDGGAAMVSKYEDFCELARALGIPKPEKSEYQDAIEFYNEDEAANNPSA